MSSKTDTLSPVCLVDVPLTPAAQAMDRFELCQTGALMLYQHSDSFKATARVCICPYASESKFDISKITNRALDNAKKTQPGYCFQPSNLQFNNAPASIFTEEESFFLVRSCLACFSCANLRALELHIAGNGAEHYLMQREFRLGGWICCNLNSRLLRSDDGTRSQEIGRVKENCEPYPCRAMESCCLCTSYDDVQLKVNETYIQRYRIRENRSCCNGSHNNCCGSTCINNDIVFDILDYNDRKVAEVSKTFAGGTGLDFLTAIFRCCCNYSNYVVTFPPGSSEEDRALILAAVHHIDYKFFEKPGLRTLCLC